MPGLIILIVFVLLFITLFIFRKQRRKNKQALPPDFRELLNEHVAYFRSLNDADKIRFAERIKDFFSYVNIHGVNTELNWLDKLLIASSGVIPVFGFEKWRYYNLSNILLYGDAFARENFSTGIAVGDTAGMVGSGALQQMMILSKPSLYAGFSNVYGKYNTGIHEFAHLLDKADGDTNGIPEQLLGKQNIDQWIGVVNKEIENIKNGGSDIDAYGATSRTEFFAVASEYFFQRPDLFKENHPELFELMTMIFHQSPVFYFAEHSS